MATGANAMEIGEPGSDAPAATKEIYRAARRPGYGSAGRPIQVKSNFFKVKLNDEALPAIQHFDVEIVSQKSKKSSKNPDVKMNAALLRKVLAGLQEQHKEPLKNCVFAYDGAASAFPSENLEFKENTFEVEIGPRDKFTVHMKRVAIVSVEALQEYIRTQGESPYPDDVVRTLQVALATTPGSRYASIGKNFFLPDDPIPLGGGCEAWKGFHSALRAVQDGLAVNVDISYNGFYANLSVTDMAKDILQIREFDRSGLSDRDRARIQREIKLLRIEVTHRKSKRGDTRFKIEGVSPLPADQEMLEIEYQGQKKKLSVAEYFAERYQPLRYPQLPCLSVQALGPRMPGRPQQRTQLPMEVCKIVEGQRRTKQLTGPMTAAMIKACNQKPDRRLQLVLNSRRTAAYEEDEILKAFGIEVDQEPVELQARFLKAPTLHFNPESRENKSVPPNGDWNMRDKKVYFAGQTIETWGVLVCLDDRTFPEREAQDFVGQMVRSFGEKGLDCRNTMPPIVRHPYPQSLRDVLREVKEKAESDGGECQLILVIKPVDNDMYRNIKIVGDTQLGIPTQCVLVDKLRRGGPQYCSNVGLKINAKLGGKNWVLSADDFKVADGKTFMILGCGITKSPIGPRSEHAVASLVGSLDPQLGKHAGTYSIQSAREGYVVSMHAMMLNLLKAFEKEWGPKKLPEVLLLYRDGTSEGNFAKVLQHEVTDIRNACAEMDRNYAPKITVVVTSKHHHVRFFPQDQSAMDRNGNCKAGVVVDATICSPRDWDFYLVSHAGIQGTSRPTRYTVLMDEIGFGPDELQQLTFNQCYTYARCPRSVSYTPVAYYASLFGQRTLHYLAGEGGMESDYASSVGSGGDRGRRERPPAALPEARPVHPRLSDVMFYA